MTITAVRDEFDVAVVRPDGDSAPVRCTLEFRLEDPYAVRATFHANGTAVEWLLARDLLRAGLTRCAGDGDVQVAPAPGNGQQIQVTLTSPSGRAVLVASRESVALFLGRTDALVPYGQERLDLDRLAQALLSI